MFFLLLRSFTLGLVLELFFIPPAVQTASRERQSADLKEITAIRTYHKEIDRFVGRNPKAKRIFANTAEFDKEAAWHEFKTEKSFEKAGEQQTFFESANVWNRNGTPVQATFLFQSPSGDWAHYVTYTFREDGTLAQIDAQLNTFYGDYRIIRERFFDSTGRLLKKTEKVLDLTTGKPKKRAADSFDQPILVYGRVENLPFFKLISGSK